MLFADVSEFQTVDWATYGPKYGAVIVRAHNGWRADNKWAQNLAGARKHCQWRGWYQYLPKSVDPAQAARAFRATVGDILPGEPMILDLEEGDGDQRARRAAWYEAMGSDVTRWTYSGLWFSGAHLPGINLDWVAAYQNTEPTVPHVLWQRSSSGTFSGIPGGVDTNQFNGTLAQLRALTEAPMALTSAEIQAIADKVWANDRVPVKWGSADAIAANPTWSAENVLSAIGQWVVQSRDNAGRAVDIATENQARITAMRAEVAAARSEVAASQAAVLSAVKASQQSTQAAVTAILDAIRAAAPGINLTDEQLAQVAEAARSGAADTLSNATIKIIPTDGQ